MGKGQRQPDYTRALIKEKLADQDQEIATTSCKVTLACPLGKMRMVTPARASTCDHLQCFDAQLYLSMNERKPKWVCPVCNKPALMENLLVDGFFMELMASPRLPVDEHEIVLHNDGTWDPLPPKIPDHLKMPQEDLALLPPPTLLTATTTDWVEAELSLNREGGQSLVFPQPPLQSTASHWIPLRMRTGVENLKPKEQGWEEM